MTYMGAPFPHCDDRVLHAPGVCEYCDHYPEQQRLRQALKILFTGELPRQGWTQCPAEQARGLDSINRWPGNRPSDGSGDTMAELAQASHDQEEQEILQAEMEVERAFVRWARYRRRKPYLCNVCEKNFSWFWLHRLTCITNRRCLLWHSWIPLTQYQLAALQRGTLVMIQKCRRCPAKRRISA